MPVVRTMGAGSTDTASGELTLRQTLSVLLPPATGVSNELAVLGLPNLGFWVTMTAGNAGAVTVTPQFAIREVTGGAAPIREYLNFQNATVLILNQPTLFSFRFPASFIRLSVANGGVIGATLDIALGASI